MYCGGSANAHLAELKEEERGGRVGEERRQEEERPWWEALGERPGVRGTDGGEGPKGIGIGVRREPRQDQRAKEAEAKKVRQASGA